MAGVEQSSKVVQFASFDGIEERSGTLWNTRAVGGSNACASSSEGIEGEQSRIRGVSFVACAQDGIEVWLGWASNEAQRGHTHYNSIAYGAFINANKCFEIYESGAYKGAFGAVQAGDIVAVVLNDQSKVDFSVNGEVRYTSQQAPQFPLYLKLCAYPQGPCVRQVQWILREADAACDAETECPECNILKDALQSLADEKLELELHLAKIEADAATVKADLLKSKAEIQALRRQLGLKSRRQSEASSTVCVMSQSESL